MLVGAESRGLLFKTAPAVSFRQAKKESLVLVSNMTSRPFIKVNLKPKIHALLINFLTHKQNFFSRIEL